MVSCTRFAAIYLALLPWSMVLMIVEGEEEIIPPMHEVDSVTEEMVCTNTQGEMNYEVIDDDVEDYVIDEESDADKGLNDDIDEEFDADHDHEFDGQECVDNYEECQFWAKSKPSECETNPNFMLTECKMACRSCDKHNRYSDEPPTNDGQDLGKPQLLKGDERISSTDIENRIAASQKYMNRQIHLGTVDAELMRSCKNTDELCTYWSLLGECEENSAYMKLSCGPACFTCDMLSIEKRCPMDRETIGPDVWSPGDLDKMFRKISSEPYKSKYDVNVLSSPDGEDRGPWALTMENFVSDEEADRLIELGAGEGYERSMDIGEMLPDGTSASVVSKGRTSWNAWCSGDCIQDEMVKAVNGRICNMTGIPEMNSEDLQLLRYEPGQHYNTHHDYIEYEIDRQGGVRIITVYLYLNDVEAGGGTNFPDLNLTVMPKRGRVLIWPSVLNSDPNEKDEGTDHQALPVEAGIKYGANAWFHMRNFKAPNNNGC